MALDLSLAVVRTESTGAGGKPCWSARLNRSARQGESHRFTTAKHGKASRGHTSQQVFEILKRETLSKIEIWSSLTYEKFGLLVNTHNSLDRFITRSGISPSTIYDLWLGLGNIGIDQWSGVRRRSSTRPAL